MNLVAFADGIALALISFEDFSGKRLLHRDAFAGIGEINQPSERERELTVGRDFERHLIGGPAYAARFDFQARFGVIHSPLKDFERVGRGILFQNLIESAIDNALGNTFVAAVHDGINQTGNEWAVEFGILDYRTP